MTPSIVPRLSHFSQTHFNQKASKIDKTGGFSSKMANIDSKYNSFIHFMIKFNSKDYSISFFSGIFNLKNYSIIFFPENSIQKLIQNFKFGLIQCNEIFIQEN